MGNAELVHQGERLDDLQIEYNGERLMVIQNPDWFCFGVDAVLLADFARVGKGDKVLDMGTGCGIIPVLLAGKTEAGHISGLEIQPDVAQMAKRTVLYNSLQQRVEIIEGDLKTFEPKGKFDVITCNPPYKKQGCGIVCPDEKKAVARHELCCTLEDVVSNGARLLKSGGALNIIHRPERLADVLCLLRKYNLEPKRVRMVYPSPSKAARMVLYEGVKNGGDGLRVLAPLYIYNPDGSYTDEIHQIYGWDK